MASLFFACSCEQAFTYHVPQKDGKYAIHCPNCIKQLQNLLVFDEGTDYEVMTEENKGDLPEQSRFYVIELEGGKFLVDQSNQFYTVYDTSDNVWNATMYPHDELPPLFVGELIGIAPKDEERIIVALHEAFITLVNRNDQLIDSK